MKGGKFIMSVQRKEKGRGFTIIEVVLVLAIGALILLMAILAFPALKKSQADTQRKSDLSRVSTAIMSYQSNNRNALPTTFNGVTDTTSWANFLDRYVVKASGEFTDPNGATYTIASGPLPSSPTFSDSASVIYVNTSSVCNGEGVKAAGSRKVAFQMILESNGIACVNN